MSMSGAEYLASIYGTEKDKVNCSFYIKTGACRHSERCSRKHNKPQYSQTVVMQNMYVSQQNSAKSADGSHLANMSDHEIQEQFEYFFEDVFFECEEKYGEIEEMCVCDNQCDHLRGNVYIKFRKEEDAVKAAEDLNNRCQTVVMQNMYVSQQNSAKSADGSHLANMSDHEIQEQFEYFFEDVFFECEEKYGEIEEMCVCDNQCDHLRGNVYIKFRKEEDAVKAAEDLNNRWYMFRPIYAELCPVADFREACCHQFEMGQCGKGGFCNFWHVKPISHHLKNLLARSSRSKYRRRSRSRSRSRERQEKHEKHRRRSRSRSRDRDRRDRRGRY